MDAGRRELLGLTVGVPADLIDPNVLLRQRPEVARVMRVLHDVRPYEEGEDAFTWAVYEAADTFDLIESSGPDCACPEAVLYETGYWAEDDGEFPERARCDLLAAVFGAPISDRGSEHG